LKPVEIGDGLIVFAFETGRAAQFVVRPAELGRQL
jgi:hypothetical protein